MSFCTNETCNNVVGSPNLYDGVVDYTDYGYALNSTAVKVSVFLALFCAVTALHVLLAVYWRRWWTLFTLCLGGSIEAIGWGGRYWSFRTTVWDPTNGGTWTADEGGYIMQIVCLIIAPTFFSAANYIYLGTLVRVTGAKYSSITPRSFSVLFTFADFICLLVQCIGGGVVGTANADGTMRTGLHIMAAGVVAQVVVTVVFAVMFAEFAWRLACDRPCSRQYDLLAWTRIFSACCRCRCKAKSSKASPPKRSSSQMEKAPDTEEALTTDADDPASTERTVGAERNPIRVAEVTLLISTILIMARSLFRCDELLDFTSSTSGAYADQNLFIAMDASLMLGLLVVFLVVHPGRVDGRALFSIRK